MAAPTGSEDLVKLPIVKLDGPFDGTTGNRQQRRRKGEHGDAARGAAQRGARKISVPNCSAGFVNTFVVLSDAWNSFSHLLRFLGNSASSHAHVLIVRNLFWNVLRESSCLFSTFRSTK